MKKLVSIILAITMCISMSAISASANSGATDTGKIIEALNVIECVKEQFELSSVDFENLEYSNPIYAYDYTANGVQYNSEFIPIKDNNSLIGWVIKATTDNDVVYQFSNAFVQQVNSITTQTTKFAFIYDQNSSYLYNGTQLYKLEDISMLVEYRVVLTDISLLDNTNIKLNNIAAKYDLQYTAPNVNTRTPIYYECSVPFISQNPPSNMCWAASVASITNYLKKTNYTAVSVAKKWFGATAYADYNKGLSLGLQDDVLKTYGISYTYKNKVPSDGVIFKNIYNGYPVLATFKWSNGYHDVVIYGINNIGGYLYVMDPEYGFCGTTYTASVGHRYVSGYSGVTLTLNRATCKYWTS